VTSELEYWRSQHTGPNRGETLPFISADHLRAGQSAFGACLGVDDRHGAGDVVFHGAPGGVLVTVAQRADDELTVVVASRHGRFQRPRHRPGRDRGRRRRRGTARNRRGHPAAGPDSRPEETAAERGITPLTPAMGLRALEFALRSNAGQLAIVQIEWTRYLSAFRGQPPTLFERFGRQQKERLIRRGKLAEELKALDTEARRARLTEFVVGEFARVSGLPRPDAVDTGRAFSEMGLDSLLALDLRNCLETELDCSLSPTLLFEHPNIVSVVEHLLLALFAEAREEFSK